MLFKIESKRLIAIASIALSVIALGSSGAFAERSGKQQLQRLLKPHTSYIRISKAARRATGNPNIIVIDRRGHSVRGGAISQCSFLKRYGQRILACD